VRFRWACPSTSRSSSARPAFQAYRHRVVDWFARSSMLQEIRYDSCTLLELDAVEDPIGEMTAARDFVEVALRRSYHTARLPERAARSVRRCE
jgi:hypothetical protein